MADLGALTYGIVLKASDDPVKRDLEMTCTACDAFLCDAEADDDLMVLAEIAVEHLAQCTETEDHRG